ncbi:MAG: T9SS type A sorting domain-containing protein, partial [Flavobacteriales bacterium]
VVILGSFNNFCGTCDTLGSIGGGLYSVELNLLPGVYEYYFGLDNGANLETLNDAACTVLADTVFHRLITVTEATILPEVCWNSCDTCDVFTSVVQNNQYSTIIFPNPANDQLNIKLNNPLPTTVELRHISGTLVYSMNCNTSQLSVPTNDLSQGVYIITLTSELGTERRVIEVIH